MQKRFLFMKSELFKMLVFSEMEPKRRGAIDFGLLGIFLFILFTLSLLILSTNGGLLNSLVDTFLSKNRDGTIPIYSTTNVGVDRPISKDILIDLKKEHGVNADIFIRGDRSTSHLYGFENSKVKKWQGKFLFEESVMWQEYVSEVNTTKNFIVLNKNSFRKHFDYELYQKELKDKNIDFPQDIFALKSIWLAFRFNMQNSLIEFEIIWVDNIYDALEIDFLLPMDIFAKQKYIMNSKQLDKSNREFVKAMDSINLSLYRDTKLLKEVEVTNKETLKLLANNFEGIVEEEYFRFNQQMKKSKFDSFLKQNNHLPNYEIVESESFDTFEIIDNDIYVTVNKEKFRSVDIDKLNQTVKEIEIKEKNKNQYVIKTSYKKIIYSFHMVAYAEGRNDLDRTRYAVEGFKYQDDQKSFFMIDPLYNNALRKLGFLTKVLDGLITPYTMILAFIFLTLIISQIVLIISRRKAQYAIAFAKGLQRIQVFDVLATQIMILTFVSGVFSFVLMKAMSLFVVWSTKESTYEYIDIIDVSKLNILPITILDLVFITVIILVISLNTAFIYMKKINICNKNGYLGSNMKG